MHQRNRESHQYLKDRLIARAFSLESIDEIALTPDQLASDVLAGTIWGH